MIMNDSARDIAYVPYCVKQTYQSSSGCIIYSIYLTEMKPNVWKNVRFVRPVNYTIEQAYRYVSELGPVYLQRTFKVVSVIHL
jgi:hypothetical protein